MNIRTHIPRALTLTLALLLAGCADNPVEPSPPEPPSATHIQGLVADEDGNAYQLIEVSLHTAGSSDAQRRITTDPQGRFAFSDLEAGDYEVAITPPRLSEVVGANPAAVSGGGAADFTLRMLPSEALVIGKDIDPIREIRNVEGTAPTEADELLYHSNDPEQLHAVLAPDGRHLTLGEWGQARGTGRVTCTAQGTLYQFALENLVPNGVYTVWNFVLDRAVTAATFPAGQVPNGGALGPSTGTGNAFTASATGEGTLEVIARPGAMSMVGQMPGCVLTQAPGSAVIVLYHIDGKTWGSMPGPEATWVAHLGIIF